MSRPVNFWRTFPRGASSPTHDSPLITHYSFVAPVRIVRLARGSTMPGDAITGRFLLLEQEDMLKTSVAERLRHHGHDVTMVETIAGARDRFAGHDFHVAILVFTTLDKSGVEFVRHLRSLARPRLRPEIVLLAEDKALPLIIETMKMGVREFQVRPCRSDVVERHAIDALHAQRRNGLGPVRLALDALAERHRLTGRERDLVLHLIAGKSNRDIGEAMNVKEDTVKTHMKNVFSKMAVSSRTGILSSVVQTIETMPGEKE